jgi:hypothetical protein
MTREFVSWRRSWEVVRGEGRRLGTDLCDHFIECRVHLHERLEARVDLHFRKMKVWSRKKALPCLAVGAMVNVMPNLHEFLQIESSVQLLQLRILGMRM